MFSSNDTAPVIADIGFLILCGLQNQQTAVSSGKMAISSIVPSKLPFYARGRYPSHSPVDQHLQHAIPRKSQQRPAHPLQYVPLGLSFWRGLRPNLHATRLIPRVSIWRPASCRPSGFQLLAARSGRWPVPSDSGPGRQIRPLRRVGIQRPVHRAPAAAA